MTTIVIIMVVVTLFWLGQLFSLMVMPDDAFPGRYDKPIWAAILLVLPVVGAVLFAIWKWHVSSSREAEAVAGQLGNFIRQSRSDTDET